MCQLLKNFQQVNFYFFHFINSSCINYIFHYFFTEWHIVQITAQHEHIKDQRHRTQPDESLYSLKPTHGLHLVVIPTGSNAMTPICITLPKPNASSSYDIRTEIETLLNTNKSNLTAVYNNHNLYWKMRKKQNEKMKVSYSQDLCDLLPQFFSC